MVGFLDSLLDDLAGEMATRPQGSVRAWVERCIRVAGSRKNADEVRAMIVELGATADGELHAVVQRKWTGPPGLVGDPRRLGAEQAQELLDVLGTLVRNARFLTTHGSPPSSWLRCDRLIRKLLTNSEPLRRPGQPVGAGHPWVLEQFLGSGASGETWTARNFFAPDQPLRVYQTFTCAGARQRLEPHQNRLLAVSRDLARQPQIVEWIEIGIAGPSHPYLAMEFVPGGSVEDWFLEDPDRRVAPNKHQIVGDLVGAMAIAHRKGICHGHLRPSLALLTQPAERGAAVPASSSPVRLKIAGFGLPGAIAGSIDAQPHEQQMYFPPEGPFGPEPAQVDVFSIGVLWYQLLVERLQRPPYDFADVLRAEGHDSQTVAMISRCLASPNQRFASAVELEKELTGQAPPLWPPVPKGCVDVSQIIREYLAAVES
jgi:serine/threonine protein kinase